MRHCIYPGTFDPITYGHLDVQKFVPPNVAEALKRAYAVSKK